MEQNLSGCLLYKQGRVGGGSYTMLLAGSPTQIIYWPVRPGTKERYKKEGE